jgi:lipopolysaccharide export system permease protein
MKVLDKYISKHFLSILVASNIISVLLFLLVSVLDSMTRLMTKNEMTVLQIIRYFSYQIPQISYYAAPLSVLFGLLLTFGTLGQRSELTVMRVSGVSWGQLSRWPLILTIVYAWLVYLLGAYLIPVANAQGKFFEIEQVNKEKTIPGADLWVFNSKDPANQSAIHINLYLPGQHGQTDKAIGLEAFNLNSDFFPFRETRAGRAYYIGGNSWVLFNARVFNYAPEAAPELIQKRTLLVELPVKPKNFLSFSKWPQELSIDELQTYIRTFKKSGFDPREFQVEYAARYSIPVACMILFALALGISIRMRRPQGIYLNVGWALFITFVYFAIMAECLSLGKSGKLPPLLAAWAGNIIFSGVAVYLLLGREKE